MPVVGSVRLCLCIAARACQHPRGPLAFWRDCVRSSTEYRVANTTRHQSTPEHIVIEGPDIGYDGRSHLGVAIDADHRPTPIAEDLTNTARAAKSF